GDFLEMPVAVNKKESRIPSRSSYPFGSGFSAPEEDVTEVTNDRIQEIHETDTTSGIKVGRVDISKEPDNALVILPQFPKGIVPSMSTFTESALAVISDAVQETKIIGGSSRIEEVSDEVLPTSIPPLLPWAPVFPKPYLAPGFWVENGTFYPINKETIGAYFEASLKDCDVQILAAKSPELEGTL